MKIILSIKPEYAEKILTGKKRFEFRKSKFSEGSVNSILIYATLPVGKVIGEFEISQVLVDKPEKIWQLTKEAAGIRRSFFDSYFRDRKTAVAIQVGKVTRYEVPLALSHFGESMTAPQSFRYLYPPG